MLFYDNLDSFIQGQRKKLENLSSANIPERGIILKVLGHDINQDKSEIVTQELDCLELDSMGILIDRHYKLHRPSTPRERSIYPKGTEIRQHRHVFAVSPYDCKVLTDLMGVEITPELLGANLVIGRTDGKDYSLSALPENTHLLIAPENLNEIPKPPISTLVRYVKQQGCGVTGKVIADAYNDSSLTKKFVDVSKDNRGIVCSIEYPVESENSAIIKSGQIVNFKFPTGEVT